MEARTTMIPSMAPVYTPSPKTRQRSRRPGTAPSRLPSTPGMTLPLTTRTYPSHLGDGAQRPHTPLDYSMLAPAQKVGEVQDGLVGGRIPRHRRTRSSVDMERPVVDPAIRGIPQGWDDDPTMALISHENTIFPKPLPPTQTRPPPNPTPHFNTPSARPTASRLSPFKETRNKLTSFSGIAKAHLGIGEVGRDAHLQRSNTRKQPTTTPVRSSSLATSHIPQQRSLPQTISETSLSSSTSPTSSSFPAHNLPELAPSTTTSPPPSTDFNHLFTPSANTQNPYTPSITSTQDSTDSHSHFPSRRERVMGLRKDFPNPITGNAVAGGSKVFLTPNMADVLPFAGSRPFAAWEVPVEEMPDKEDVKGMKKENGLERGGGRGRIDRRTSVVLGLEVEEVTSQEGWKDLGMEKGGSGKRVWVDAAGEQIAGVYRVGWERDVLDLEARLHEMMYDLAGDRHTFAEYEAGKEPKTVLDIGTGTGNWPISQALIWSETRFVGLDIVPCQTDLSILAAAERRARSTSSGQVEGLGMWESVEKRITWDRANFLETLPYDTGVFDHVHLRFVNLGLPETRWYDLLEESLRVLKSGGMLEIVETTYTLPSHSAPSLRNSFASLLLADLVQPVPKLSIQFNLPLLPGIRSGASKPIWEGSGSRDGVEGWVKSCLDYKGTGIVKGGGGENLGRRARRALAEVDANRWVGERSDAGEMNHGTVAEDASVWAWVCKKQ